MSPTSTPNQPRQHKGVPAGGQWRSVPKPEGPPLLGPGEGTAPAGATEQPDERLVRARDVLLAGLNALGPQREALTVVGAQAVFEHTRGRNDISLTLTVDGDTSVAPALVDPSFDIGQAMTSAGFVAHPGRPGIWGLPGLGDETTGFDLLVPGALAGPGRRGARVPGQDRHAIGRADGLELSLLDREKRALCALDGSGRSLEAYVAGPAALMCAKAHKLAERLAQASGSGRDRVKAKDAADVWRLMMVSDPAQVRSTFARFEDHEVLGPPIARGRAYLEALFGPGGPALALATASLGNRVAEGYVAKTIAQWMARFRA